MGKSIEHLRLAIKFLSEGENYIAKGDSVQASEKLYKAAEESIKAMSSELNLEPHRKAVERGRWSVTLLDDAVYMLSEKVDGTVKLYWDAAYRLHVDGFHEAMLRISDVEARLEGIKRLVKLAEGVMKSSS